MPDARPDLRLLLPGSWWTIPLDTEEHARKSVNNLIKRVAGRDDRLATFRANLRAEFMLAISTARTGNASELYLALEIAPGLPLPSSLTVYWPEFNVLGALQKFPENTIKLIKVALDASASGGGYTDEEEITIGQSATLRRCRETVKPGSDGGPDSRTLLVNYWMTVPGTQRIVALTFSTTLVELKDQMLELYKAIVGTMSWTPVSAPSTTDGVLATGLAR